MEFRPQPFQSFLVSPLRASLQIPGHCSVRPWQSGSRGGVGRVVVMDF